MANPDQRQIDPVEAMGILDRHWRRLEQGRQDWIQQIATTEEAARSQVAFAARLKVSLDEHLQIMAAVNAAIEALRRST